MQDCDDSLDKRPLWMMEDDVDVPQSSQIWLTFNYPKIVWMTLRLQVFCILNKQSGIIETEENVFRTKTGLLPYSVPDMNQTVHASPKLCPREKYTFAQFWYEVFFISKRCEGVK